MSNTVLMVVDVQNALVEEHPYQERKLIENIKKLIQSARESRTEVIYVQHEDEETVELARGSVGWQVYGEVAPRENERAFGKQYNSAFHHTDLKQYLDSRNIDTIILVGLQTEYCIDATCKSAFDFEYKVIIPEETNSTFDNAGLSAQAIYEFYNNQIWNHRFAEVVAVEEAEKMMREAL